MDEAEHCQNLVFIQRGAPVAPGSPETLEATRMQGAVIEGGCGGAGPAIGLLRELDRFEEVALYGSLIHVVTTEAQSHLPLIKKLLVENGLTLNSVERISPSLEDVFISSAREAERILGGR